MSRLRVENPRNLNHSPFSDQAQSEPVSPLLGGNYGNSIELILNKEEFSSTEAAQGHVLITIAHSFHAKRITLSILGEIISQAAPVVKKEMILKRIKTSMTSLKETKVQRTFTAGKNAPKNGLQKVKPDQGGPTRTFTLMNKRPMSPSKASNSRAVVPEVRNHELFCHYSIPLFTFKTSTLPPGVYRIPFKFFMNPKMLPTTEYSAANDGIQLAVNYKVIAELEENPDDDGNDRDEGIYHGQLKVTKDIKVHQGQVQSPTLNQSQGFTGNEILGKLKIPRLFCIIPTGDIKVRLKLPKTTIILGEEIKYQLESIEKPLKENKIKVVVNIVEEMTLFGRKGDPKKTVLDNSKMKFSATKEQGSDDLKDGSLILGDVETPKNIELVFSTPTMNVEYFFEVILMYMSTANKQAISLRTPITLKKKEEQPEQCKEVKLDKSKKLEKEEAMELPMVKFKLDEKYNLLTKTADILNDCM